MSRLIAAVASSASSCVSLVSFVAAAPVTQVAQVVVQQSYRDLLQGAVGADPLRPGDTGMGYAAAIQ